MALATLIDRERELASLERAWEQAAGGRPQLAVVWGRRRVGKTFLLSHFAEHRRAVFFGATQQAEGIELARLADTVRRDLGDRAADLAGGRFASWEAALRFFAALAVEESLTVVLDEVPYLVRSTEGFASIVQAVWDHIAQGTKLMLVLTGSAIAMMEAMVGAGGALRGRATLTLRL
ncbi:MAG: ATP-binding protein, partial [Solirubrobacteraceae bacterium]